MSLTPVFYDMETFWSQNYSLTKLTPIEYVMGVEYETQSVALKVGLDGPTEVIFGHEAIAERFARIDWSSAWAIAHNNEGFDALILAWKFGIKPKLWGCTLAMSRPLHALDVGGSLKALAAHYGLQAKGSLEAVNTKGKRLADFNLADVAAMKAYNAIDVELCAELFKRLVRQTTTEELRLIDMTVRMIVEPGFEVDTELLVDTLRRERLRKGEMLDKLSLMLGCTHSHLSQNLRSAPRFSALLADLGAAVPMKTSPKTGKEIPALAKTDEGMQELLDHDDPVVAMAAAVRLDTKSTILETRLQRFIDASRLCGGKMPIPLKYYAATTGRWGGMMKLNCFGGDTEVLTPEGWVRFDAWDGSPIMQWWPDGRLSFEQTPGYLKRRHDGPTVSISSRLVSGLFTPEHRFVSCPPTKSGIKERTAGWIAESSGLDNIPTCGLWDGAVVSLYTPDEARLMVAIAADGSVNALGRFSIGLRKQRKIGRMEELLAACGVVYSRHEYAPQKGHVGDTPTVTFKFYDERFSKGFGPWILRLSAKSLRAAAEEVVHWDGWSHQNGGSANFCSVDIEQTKWVATLWHLTGSAARLRTYDSSDKKHQQRYVLHRRTSRYTSVATKSDVSVAPFSGDVYCASVESSYILVRHNNGIFVCGQCQNLPRVDPDKPKLSDALRKSLRAPRGHKVVVADLSGIELRVNHFLWKVQSSMDAFKADPKADLYRLYAAIRLHKDPEDVTKDERRLAKVEQLGLGYGAGWKTFQKVARTMGGLVLSDQAAKKSVWNWRDTYQPIVRGWEHCEKALHRVYNHEIAPVDPWGLCMTDNGGIHIPKGVIRYPNLRRELSDTAQDKWYYGEGRNKTFIAGFKVDENLVQAISRRVMTDVILAFARTELGRKYTLAHTVHDEVVYVVEDRDADDVLGLLLELMSTPPSWWPELITTAEGDIAQNYGDAK